MKKKMIYVDAESYDGYTLYVFREKEDGVNCYNLFLKKEDFADLQYMCGIPCNEVSDIEEVFAIFAENLENGNFFYELDSVDANFEDRFDLVVE